MKSKNKYECSKCGTTSHGMYGPMLDLCRRCFSKGKFETRIPNGPLIFNQNLNVQLQLKSTVNITESQADVLEKRLNYLFPYRSKHHRSSKVYEYIRLLILNDIASHSKPKTK